MPKGPKSRTQFEENHGLEGALISSEPDLGVDPVRDLELSKPFCPAVGVYCLLVPIGANAMDPLRADIYVSKELDTILARALDLRDFGIHAYIIGRLESPSVDLVNGEMTDIDVKRLEDSLAPLKNQIIQERDHYLFKCVYGVDRG